MQRSISVNGNWNTFLQHVNNLVEQNDNRKLYMILSQGWVYEGYKKEIFDVLSETDYLLEDFYIVSPDFDWTISYCDDGETAVLYKV